jgi:osmotically-inducible protein OsmY
MKTDMELRDDVLEELRWDCGVKVAEIGVAVRDGVATLSGAVDSYAEKCEAERAAQRVVGVKAVAVDIQIKVPGASERTDADIAGAAKDTLLWNVAVPDDEIKVLVEHGRITLSGEVERYDQKEAAELAVRQLTGMKGVYNEITIKPAATSAEIKTRIERALERTAEVDAQRITVEMHDGRVILRGSVRSWAERKAAEQAAWAAPGVSNVDDHIVIRL